MPSNSEMYERGALDAQQDDLNTFYYQHYYYYRRGYDDARRQLRGGFLVQRPLWLLPLLAVLTLALVFACVAGFWLRGFGTQTGASGVVPTQATTSQVPTFSALATPSPAPTVVAIPTALPALRIGGLARVVNVGDVALRARVEPGLARSIRVVARFPEGSEVTITEGPREVDGLTWWRIKGKGGEGWSAERSADGQIFLNPIP